MSLSEAMRPGRLAALLVSLADGPEAETRARRERLA
jgi:hypothetical protein